MAIFALPATWDLPYLWRRTVRCRFRIRAACNLAGAVRTSALASGPRGRRSHESSPVAFPRVSLIAAVSQQSETGPLEQCAGQRPRRPSFEEARANPAWWGRLVENAVGSHLLNRLPPAAFSVTYWRDAGEEVDFVVERGTTTWAVEVKSGRGQKVSGLQRFRQQYPESRMFAVGREGMPLSTFFDTPPEVLFGA